MRMVRKQVYILPEQEKRLKRRAREMGVSEAELIRRGIDQIGKGGAAFAPDLQAWEEARAYICQRRQMKVPQTGRGWRREDLYEERLGRYSR